MALLIASNEDRAATLASAVQKSARDCMLATTSYDAQSDLSVESYYSTAGKRMADALSDLKSLAYQCGELIKRAASLFAGTDSLAAQTMDPAGLSQSSGS